MKRKALSLLLTLAMLLSLVPAFGTAASAAADVTVASNTNIWTDGNNYIVSSSVEISGGVTVNGTVTLTINSGCTLTVTGTAGTQGTTGSTNSSKFGHAGTGASGTQGGAAITVESGMLTIVGSGALNVTGGDGGTGGIGGTATGQNSYGGTGGKGGDGGAGIGGTGSLVLNGTTVSASGGTGGTGGIGGQGTSLGGDGGNGGNGGAAITCPIEVKSGALTARGGQGGIGGNPETGGGTVYKGLGGNGGHGITGSVTVTGGTVTAVGGAYGENGTNGQTPDGSHATGDGVSATTITGIIKAGGAANPTTVVEATALSGKQYVTITPPQAQIDFLEYDTSSKTFVTKSIGGADGADYTRITKTNMPTTWGTFGKTTYYVVDDTDIEYTGTNNSGVVVQGDVRLILKDGKSLSVTGDNEYSGINVSYNDDNYKLTIYAQSTGENKGELTANGGDNGAGIGGNNEECNGPVTIHGGKVTANGSSNGAGIGGGYSAGSNITIYGGTVTATGGSGAAGIGGGMSGSGSYISVTGGTVTATGGYGGAGIGGGMSGNGSYISVTGGTVIATADAYSGIGGGQGGDSSNITVDTALEVKAGASAADTVIANDGSDLASSLTGSDLSPLPYVTITPKTVCYIDTNKNGVLDSGEIKYPSIEAALNAPYTSENDTNPTKIVLIANDTENVTIPAGRNITLDLNGYVLKADLSGGSSIIENKGILTIDDSNGSENTYYFSYIKCEHGVKLLHPCDECTIAGHATGYAVIETNAVFTQYSTVRPEGTEGEDYRAVSGGIITGGVLQNGGVLNFGTLTLLGGTVINNMAAQSGGGVSNNDGATFVMNGGAIIGNIATSSGAGVCNTGSFHMKNGIIEDNIAYSYLSGVDNLGSFKMDGGSIRNNLATLCGGGVGNQGTMMIIGGNAEISGNIANGKNDNLLAFAPVSIGTGEGGNGIAKPSWTTPIGITLVDASGYPTIINIAGTFTTNGTADDVKYFCSDEPVYTVKHNTDHLELAVSDDYEWFFEQQGTEDYIISNIDELEAFAYIVNTGYNFGGYTVKLSDDYKNVKMDGTAAALTTPIGKDITNCFAGTFDGNGKTVKLNITSGTYGGLFGVVQNAQIKNVLTTGTINLTAAGSIAGGIVAYAGTSHIVNCGSTASVTADNKVGGIAGERSDGIIANCYAATTLAAANVSGIAGGSGETHNCYYLDSIAGKGVGGETDTTIALPASQMKAGADESKAANDSSVWKDITVDSNQMGAVSLSDALNKFVNSNSGNGYCRWGVMNSTVNNGYPVFGVDYHLRLVDGKAYKGIEEIPLPDGITYENGKYIFNNVNYSSLGEHGYLSFVDQDTIIQLKGKNQIGVKADISPIGYYSSFEKYAQNGIAARGNLSFTGSGSLTIYEESKGIILEENQKELTFRQDFTGTVTIYDHGVQGAACGLTNQNGTIHIKNGTLVINSTNSFGINASNINITGGTIYVKGAASPKSAVNAYTALTIANTMEISGANETYVATTKSLSNKAGTEYVVIKTKQAQSSNSGSSTVTVPVSGDKDTVKVQATVNGTNATINNVTSEEITQVGTGAEVVIDLTSLNKSVTGVTIPKTTFENVAASSAKGLEVKLPNGTVAVFDKTTLAAVASQAKDANIQLVVDRDSKAEQSMTKAQKEAVSEMNKPVVLDAYFVSNGVRISDFKGGEANITATYETTNPVRVWYVTDDGTKELVPNTFDGKVASFTVTHFSHYVIEMLDGTSYDSCPQDSTCVYAKFSDANPKEWYHSGVHFCVEYGYMKGVDNGLFAPNGTLSRAMIVTMLWRIEDSPVVNYAMSFKDVPADFWYTEAIRWAQSTGVVLGYDESTFGPEDNVTREQLAAILWRYAKLKGYDVSVGEDTNILSYDDAIGGISEYAIPAMQWACGAGIINGIGTRLEARGFATRAQAACMIQRFCVNIAK